MTDVILHFRGEGSDKRSLAAVPAVGAYLREADQLWRVADVVFDRGNVRSYLIAVPKAQASTLQKSWATWGAGISVVGT